jgi:short-subunit dehydrogenase
MKYVYRTALITGASSGIGREFARVLAAEGVNLVLVARRAERLKELAAELSDGTGVDVEIFTADLGAEADLQSVEQRLADPERPIELLVNNAGYASAGAFADLPASVSTEQVQVNVIAPIRLTRAVLPSMIARGRGGVIMMSSMAAALPLPRSSAYGASKAFLTSLSETLYMELRSSGVHVTSVAAGLTRTEFHTEAEINTAGIPSFAWGPADQVAKAGVAAVAAGRVLVIPGTMNKMQLPFFKFAPRRLLRRLAVWS